MSTRLLLVLLCLGLVGAILYATSDYPRHDAALRRMEEELAHIQHPVGTTFVSKRAKLGLLFGSENHCDFFVGELRSTDLSRGEVASFYQRQSISTDSGPVGLEVSILDKELQKRMPPGLESPESWRPLREYSSEAYLYVVSATTTDKAGDDRRCR